MEQEPPAPHLTGEPIPETEEMPPDPKAPAWRRFQHFLFFVPHRTRTAGEIIWWWEKRRLAYNGIVGVFGMLTLLLFGLSMQTQAGSVGSMTGVLFVGIAANVCYCAGWIGEILLQWFFIRHRRHRIGRVLMNLALCISLFVVVTPGLIISLLLLLDIVP